MNNRYIKGLLAFIFVVIANSAHAQLVDDDVFLAGNWLEACMAPNGAWGNTVAPPATYVTHTGGSTYYTDPVTGTSYSGGDVDFIYNTGHGGWSVAGPSGSPTWGPYYLPGTPFDGWSMQVNGIMGQAFYTTTGFATLSGAVFGGTNYAYDNNASFGCAEYQKSQPNCIAPNTKTGYWKGYFIPEGTDTLAVFQENRIDTQASWDVVTIKFVNKSSTAMTGLYYFVTADPDNDEPYPGGSFPTNNHIQYQNDARHRVMVEARPPSGNQDAYSSLCTRDCRAQAMIYQSWPPSLTSGNDLDLVATASATGMSTCYYTLDDWTWSQDIAYGLIFTLGDLPAGDSAILSFAWNFKDSTCTDSAFQDPQLVVDGAVVGQPDTVQGLGVSCTIPVCLAHANEKAWSWANWTWSPSTGLSATTGTQVTINRGAISAMTTYTITGNDSTFGMHSCNTYQLYLVVAPCFGADNNSEICEGAMLKLWTTGDSTGATYKWINPGGTVVSTLNTTFIYPATYADSGTWTVVRTQGGTSDTSHTHVIIRWKPTLTLTTNAPLCAGMVDTLTLGAAPDSVGETFLWTGPGGFTSTLVNPVIDGFGPTNVGTYTLVVTSSFGCKDTATINALLITEPAIPTITGITQYCSGEPFVPFTVTGYTGTLLWYTSGIGGASSNTAPTMNTSYGHADTFWVAQQIGMCIGPRDSIIVRVVVTPNAPTITGSHTYCQYDTYVPPVAAGSNILWYTTPTGGTGTTTVPVINTAIPGVTTLYATQEDSGCTSPRGPFVITVNVLPLPPIVSGDTVYCQGATPIPFTLTGVTGTLLWYTSATGGVGSTTATPINTATPGVTTYWVAQTNGFCTSSRASITVHVHPTPATPVISGTTDFCLNEPPTTTFTAPSVGTGFIDWYTVLGGVPSLTPPVLYTNILGNQTVYATQVDSGCTSLVDSFTITVHAIPAELPITGTRSYCLNDAPIPFTILDVVDSVLWYTNPSQPLASGSLVPTVINTSVAGTQTFWIRQWNGFCYSPIDSITIDVHPIPGTPTITGKSIYCQFDSFIYPQSLPTGSGIIQWYTMLGGVPTIFVPTVSTLVPGLTTIYAQQVDSGCLSNLDSFKVLVNPRPNEPLITDTPNVYCPGQPFVPFTIDSGINLLWYTVDTLGTGSTITPTISTIHPGTYNYWVTQTSDSGCVSRRFKVSVTVFDSVVAAFSDSIKLGCNGDSVWCTNHSTGAENYEWHFGDNNSSNETDPMHIYMSQGTFGIELIAYAAHCMDSATKTITLNHPLSASFTVSPSDTICQNSPLHFASTVTSDVPPTYVWSFGDGTTSAFSNPTHSFPVTGVYTVALSVTDFVPCTVSSYQVITVDTMTPIIISVSDSVLCQGAVATFTGLYSVAGNTSLTWALGDGTDSVKGKNPMVYSYNSADVYTLTVIATFRACPDEVATRKITVLPQPQISLGQDTSICPGGAPIILTDGNNLNVGGTHWLWSNGDTSSIISVGAPGVYYVTISRNGCYASDTIIVSKNCYMDIPNVFTPNGDGVNDYFYPRQYLTKGLSAFSMTIYNRWGEQIFQSTSINGRGWDGKLNGMDQPEGVYVYIIDAVFVDGNKEHQQGNITLMR